ncbi:GumC family protein [Meridianimarinicoccus zhengii]|uniref:GumC family protein n=1 Tax=Meridianimarinicoccus zhengii TaxID=2056810 RepID=UPI001F4694D8|nr:polysaccharide biosynthesis tyrosine autokinase [Phycocomes zhengii]
MNQTRSLSPRPSPITAVPSGQDQVRPAPAADKDDEIDLLALLATLWRGKWWIALVTFLAMGVGGYYAFIAATPLYTASATVVLDNREEQVVDLQNVMSGLSGDQATVNTEVEVLQSRGLARKLVDELSLLDDPEFNAALRPTARFSLGTVLSFLGLSSPSELDPQQTLDKTIDNVLAATSVSNVRQSYVFRVTMVTESARKSALMANTLAEVYIEDQLAVKYAATDGAVEWLANRVSELKIEVEEAEQAVKNFNASTDLISPEALEALNRQSKDIRARIDEAELARLAAQDRRITLTAVRDTGDRVVMAQTADDPTLTRLVDLPDGDAAFDARMDTLIQRAALDRDRAEAQRRALEASLESLNTRIEAQSEDLVQLQQLRREAEATATIYTFFLNRLKETEVQRGIQQPDSCVLSEAVVPTAASAPRKPLVLALSMMLGLMAGSALVLGREAMQNTFRSSEELAESSGMRVLGTIPRIPARKRRMVVDYILSKPASNAAEAIRNLRTSLMLSNVDAPPQVILSTSSVPSEGKTTLSILLAHNLAALGKRVLLIEGDMRRRVFSSYFDIDKEVGLVGVLTGEVPLDQAVTHNAALGIDVLHSEKPNANAADLYSSDRFAAMLDDMRHRYDVIIVDTPPVLVVPDARVAARHVDAVVMSVRWDHTHKAQVRAALEMFSSVGIKVTGLVLGQVDPKGLKRYGYGQYGGYGQYYGGYHQN